MVKRIIWSKRAYNDRIEIFKYWNQRNKSTEYSKKLNELFKEAIKLISEYPKIGKSTENNSIRLKIIRDYLIIYEVDDSHQLLILAIWDSRQNPGKLEKLLKK